MSLLFSRLRFWIALLGISCLAGLLVTYPSLVRNMFTTTYLPHGFCFNWNGRLLIEHVTADTIIFCSYVAIAATLVWMVVAYKREIPFQRIFLAFGTFIVACGFTHLLAIVVLWSPLYWLEGAVKLATALASLFTAVVLPFYLPRIRDTLQRASLSSENESRFLAAAESSLDSLFLLGTCRTPSGEIDDFQFIFVNGVAARLVGMERDQLIGKRMCELLPENRSQGFFEKYRRVVLTGDPLVGEFPLREFHDVSASWMKIQAVKLNDGVAVTASDISERKLIEAERTRSFTESLIASSPAAVIVTSLDATIHAINPAGEKMLWYRSEELVGAKPLLLFDPGELDERALRLSAEFSTNVTIGEALFFIGQTKGIEHDGEWTLLRKGGSRVSAQVTVTPLRLENGQPSGFMITAYDISERKRREEYVSHVSQHDALTGLPTRQLLYDRLEMMLARAARYQTRCALLMIDLDHFKKVNDSMGHHAGDELLVQVATRLRSSLRAVDTVARMGGDEFVILLSDLTAASDACLVAEKLRNALRLPFAFRDQHTAIIGASIGICMYPDSAGDAQSLLRNADVAMYHAKAVGDNSIKFFSDDLAGAAFRRLEIEEGLREALRSGGLELHYQPEIDLQSGQIVGLEALLRWQMPGLGYIGPAEFIPIAEEAGLIQPIGAWVLNRACRDITEFNRRTGRSHFVAVNLSPHQAEQSDLLSVITNSLHDNRLDPALLEIEITEGLLMKDSPVGTSTLEGLRKLGVRIAIDDFGTGFSSMSYLLRFAVDTLKIDRSFVRGCSEEVNSSTVTSAIIALGHQLSLSVIAEGVETSEQAAFLKSAGCDLVQGYYYSKPIALDVLLETLLSGTYIKPTARAATGS